MSVDLLILIVQLIVAILAAVGIGKLLELAFKARQERKKVKDALDSANAGKAIDADVNAFDSILGRLTLVENRLDKVGEELTNQKVENAKLEAENLRLTKDNERQEKEIERQREKLHELANDVQSKNLEIHALRTEVTRLSKLLEGLSGANC